MRFWDTSALVPLLVKQPDSKLALRWVEEDPQLVAWWGTVVECASAVARLRREAVIDAVQEAHVNALLDVMRGGWTEILPSERVRADARRLLRVHPLRAADALQLAAALTWAGTPDGHTVVTLDERMAYAARLEGFELLPG